MSLRTMSRESVAVMLSKLKNRLQEAWKRSAKRSTSNIIDERFFYHSFPRLRPGDQMDEVVEKGLAILNNIKELGLVIAPEIVEWKQPLVDGSNRITRLRQKRISFTELARIQVKEHGKKFGPFSLEFKIDALRRLGALPVIYMPQSLRASGDLSTLGAMIVTQLGDVKYTINQLHNLSQISDPRYIMMNLAPPGATHVEENYTLNLQNVDDKNTIVATRTVPAKVVRDVIDHIGFRNAPFELMIGVLSLVQTLFYPTDDELHDDLLSYYRQREWRIVGGLLFNGVAHGRQLTDVEKGRLLMIDKRFWSRQISDDQGAFRRIDETVVIDRFEGKPISALLSSIFVPPEAFDRTRSLFGDIVKKAE